MSEPESDPTRLGSISSERLRLPLVGKDAIEQLLAGRRPEAEAILGCAIPNHFPDDGDRSLLRLRLGQIDEDAAAKPWLLRAVVLRADDLMIGHAGFHGPPDEGGAVELGYSIFLDFRRNGYAIEAVRALMNWASKHHGIERFRASIGPWNEPSLNLAAKLGFVRVGEQWEEEDGYELVFEVSSGERVR